VEFYAGRRSSDPPTVEWCTLDGEGDLQSVSTVGTLRRVPGAGLAIV